MPHLPAQSQAILVTAITQQHRFQKCKRLFLPASIRLIAVLLFGELGAVGLAFGAFVTVWSGTTSEWSYDAGLAISSGIAPLASVALSRKLMGIGADLAGLRPASIVVLSISGAAANAAMLNGYMFAVGRLNSDFGQIATVAVGDTLGTAIVLFVLSLSLTFALPKHR